MSGDADPMRDDGPRHAEAALWYALAAMGLLSAATMYAVYAVGILSSARTATNVWLIVFCLVIRATFVVTTRWLGRDLDEIGWE